MLCKSWTTTTWLNMACYSNIYLSGPWSGCQCHNWFHATVEHTHWTTQCVFAVWCFSSEFKNSHPGFLHCIDGLWSGVLYSICNANSFWDKCCVSFSPYLFSLPSGFYSFVHALSYLIQEAVRHYEVVCWCSDIWPIEDLVMDMHLTWGWPK